MKHPLIVDIINLLNSVVCTLIFIQCFAETSPHATRACTWSSIILLITMLFGEYMTLTLAVNKLKRWGNTSVYITMHVINGVCWSVLSVLWFLAALCSIQRSYKLCMASAALSHILGDLNKLAIIVMLGEKPMTEAKNDIALSEPVAAKGSAEPWKETAST